MNIHNSMEDVVSKEVNSLYEEFKTDHITWLSCDCEICRLDTICYVLNRIAPKYTVSERGYLHNALDLNDSQLKIDITSLALEGIRLINSSQRAYHKNKIDGNEHKHGSGESYYNFPMLIGTVYDGTTFEPLSDVSITMKIGDQVCKMHDSTWANPAMTHKSTQGSYSFWPSSISCKKDDGPKVFSLSFEVTAPTYMPTTYAITLPLMPEDEIKESLATAFSLKIKDIFLIHTGTTNPME